MKNKLLTLMLIVCSSLFLVNCAKNNSSGSATTTVATVGTCSNAGEVYTQYGCAPQSSYCPAGYGYINNSCYPATTTTTANGGTCQAGHVGTVMGCLPQGSCATGYGYYYGSYNGVTQGWCYLRTY